MITLIWIIILFSSLLLSFNITRLYIIKKENLFQGELYIIYLLSIWIYVVIAIIIIVKISGTGTSVLSILFPFNTSFKIMTAIILVVAITLIIPLNEKQPFKLSSEIIVGDNEQHNKSSLISYYMSASVSIFFNWLLLVPYILSLGTN